MKKELYPRYNNFTPLPLLLHTLFLTFIHSFIHSFIRSFFFLSSCLSIFLSLFPFLSLTLFIFPSAQVMSEDGGWFGGACGL